MALGVPPQRVDMAAVGLAAIRAAWAETPAEQKVALQLLMIWRMSPLLASEFPTGKQTAESVRRGINTMLPNVARVDDIDAVSAAHAAVKSTTRALAETMFRMERPLDPPLPDPFDGVMDDSALADWEVARECACCGAKGCKLQRCTACHAEWYCDANCQRGDWSRHKRACRRVAQTAPAAVAAALAASAAAAAWPVRAPTIARTIRGAAWGVMPDED